MIDNTVMFIVTHIYRDELVKPVRYDSTLNLMARYNMSKALLTKSSKTDIVILAC